MLLAESSVRDACSVLPQETEAPKQKPIWKPVDKAYRDLLKYIHSKIISNACKKLRKGSSLLQKNDG